MSRSVLLRYASQRSRSKFTRVMPAISRASSVGGRLQLGYCTAEKIESVGERRLQIPKRPTCLLAACVRPGGWPAFGAVLYQLGNRIWAAKRRLLAEIDSLTETRPRGYIMRHLLLGTVGALAMVTSASAADVATRSYTKAPMTSAPCTTGAASTSAPTAVGDRATSAGISAMRPVPSMFPRDAMMQPAAPPAARSGIAFRARASCSVSKPRATGPIPG